MYLFQQFFELPDIYRDATGNEEEEPVLDANAQFLEDTTEPVDRDISGIVRESENAQEQQHTTKSAERSRTDRDLNVELDKRSYETTVTATTSTELLRGRAANGSAYRVQQALLSDATNNT